MKNKVTERTFSRITADEKAWLLAKADELGTTESQLVRKAIRKLKDDRPRDTVHDRANEGETGKVGKAHS